MKKGILINLVFTRIDSLKTTNAKNIFLLPEKFGYTFKIIVLLTIDLLFFVLVNKLLPEGDNGPPPTTFSCSSKYFKVKL